MRQHKAIVMGGFGLAALVLLGGCEQQKAPVPKDTKVTSEDVQKKVRDAADAVGEYSAEQAGKAAELAQGRLTALKESIAQMKDQSGEVSEAARKQLNEKLENAEKQLEKMKDAGGKNWKDARAGFDKASDELDKSYREAMDAVQKAVGKKDTPEE